MPTYVQTSQHRTVERHVILDRQKCKRRVCLLRVLTDERFVSPEKVEVEETSAALVVGTSKWEAQRDLTGALHVTSSGSW